MNIISMNDIFFSDKKEPINFYQIRSLIIDLNLSRTVLELFQGNCNINELQYEFKSPSAIFALPRKKQNAYFVNRYKPILSWGTDIYAYDIKTKKFVRYNLEYCRKKFLKPMSWDCLFFPHIIQWWEYEVPDETILKYGELLGVKHTKMILERKIEAHEQDNDYDKWERALKKELNKME